MKFTVKKEILSDNINKIIGAAGKASGTPILQSIKIEAKENKIIIYATNLDIFIKSSFDCDIDQEGAAVVNIDIFNNIVKKYQKDSDITINLDGDILNIKSGRSRLKLSCLDLESFPCLDSDEGSCFADIILNSNDLINAINKSLNSVSNDQTRYYLTGVNFKLVENKLKISSTNGNILSSSLIDVDSCNIYNESDLIDVILPKDLILDFLKASNKSKCHIKFYKNRISFILDNTVIFGKLIDGQFPDIDKIIPSDNNKKIKVNRSLLKSSVDRVITGSSDLHKQVKLTFNDNKLDVSCSYQLYSGNEILDCDYSDNEFVIGFNGKFLIDILSLIGSEDVTLELKDQLSPMLINDGVSKFVLMPIRI